MINFAIKKGGPKSSPLLWKLVVFFVI